jgi:hypothetical protein
VVRSITRLPVNCKRLNTETEKQSENRSDNFHFRLLLRVVLGIHRDGFDFVRLYRCGCVNRVRSCYGLRSFLELGIDAVNARVLRFAHILAILAIILPDRPHALTMSYGDVLARERIPDRVQSFIFKFIDSVEQLDILLFLRMNREKWWSAQDISRELRSNPESVQKRLEICEILGILHQLEGENHTYRFAPSSPELEEDYTALAEAYRICRFQVMEMIFSPIKKARTFANAFLVKPPTTSGDSDG